MEEVYDDTYPIHLIKITIFKISERNIFPIFIKNVVLILEKESVNKLLVHINEFKFNIECYKINAEYIGEYNNSHINENLYICKSKPYYNIFSEIKTILLEATNDYSIRLYNPDKKNKFYMIQVKIINEDNFNSIYSRNIPLYNSEENIFKLINSLKESEYLNNTINSDYEVYISDPISITEEYYNSLKIKQPLLGETYSEIIHDIIEDIAN